MSIHPPFLSPDLCSNSTPSQAIKRRTVPHEGRVLQCIIDSQQCKAASLAVQAVDPHAVPSGAAPGLVRECLEIIVRVDKNQGVALQARGAPAGFRLSVVDHVRYFAHLRSARGGAGVLAVRRSGAGRLIWRPRELSLSPQRET
jgi:hypothetical protein